MSPGEYIAVRNDFNQEVTYAYIESFEFNELSIDEALRLFLSCFRIPGEAQVIDRIMEKFAEIYCKVLFVLTHESVWLVSDWF